MDLKQRDHNTMDNPCDICLFKVTCDYICESKYDYIDKFLKNEIEDISPIEVGQTVEILQRAVRREQLEK